VTEFCRMPKFVTNLHVDKQHKRSVKLHPRVPLLSTHLELHKPNGLLNDEAAFIHGFHLLQDYQDLLSSMKTFGLTVALVSVLGLAHTTTATRSWRDLAISAPQYVRYLARTTSGEPFFWQADTAWELVHKLSKTSIDFYLKTRAEQGYNAVQTVVIRKITAPRVRTSTTTCPSTTRTPHSRTKSSSNSSTGQWIGLQVMAF